MSYPIDTVDALIAKRFFVPGGKILDIGCGNGRFAVSLRPYNFLYTGLDIQKFNVFGAVRKFKRYPNFRFFYADIFNNFYNPWGTIKPIDYKFIFKDSAFDNIICHSLFTHLGEIAIARNYMTEIKRVLKPGGKLWITFFQSPPNAITDSEARTVYHRTDINQLLNGFTIDHTEDGETPGNDDQLKLIATKL